MKQFTMELECGINIDKPTAELALKIVDLFCKKNDCKIVTNNEGNYEFKLLQ